MKIDCYYLFELHGHMDRLIIGKRGTSKFGLKYIEVELSYKKRR